MGALDDAAVDRGPSARFRGLLDVEGETEIDL